MPTLRGIAVALALASALLCGCTFWRALTFQSDPNSYQRAGTHADLTVKPLPASRDCTAPIEAAALVAAAVGVIASIAESEVQSYLTQKQKEFTATYNGQSNVSFFYGEDPGAKGKYHQIQAQCMTLVRSIDVAGKRESAFQWVGRLIGNDSGTAWKIHTDAVLLKKAAARTDRSSHKVDVKLEVKIEAMTVDEKGVMTA